MRPFTSSFLSSDSVYAERQRRLAEEKLSVARATLPQEWDWQRSKAFGVDINSGMAACFYAAGFRDLALAGLAHCDGVARAQTCQGDASAIELAAESFDYEFVESAEKFAAARERQAREAAAAQAETTLGVSYETVKPLLTEEGARAWALAHFWEGRYLWPQLMERAVLAGDTEEGRAGREFWKARFKPSVSLSNSRNNVFTESSWKKLLQAALAQRDETTLAWMLSQEDALPVDDKGAICAKENSSRQFLLTESLNLGWVKPLFSILPQRFSFSDKEIDQAAQHFLRSSSELPNELFCEQIDFLAERARPGPHRLALWLNLLIGSADNVYGDTASEKKERCLARIAHLLDMGADPTIPRLPHSDADESVVAERLAGTIDASAFCDLLMKPITKGASLPRDTREHDERVGRVLAKSPALARLDEKASFSKAVGGVVRRKFSVLGLALLGGRFELAHDLAQRGADWRSAKNLFDSPTTAQDHPEANAFFESMQLRELTTKVAEKSRKKRAANEPAADSIERAQSAMAAPSPRRRL